MPHHQAECNLGHQLKGRQRRIESVFGPVQQGYRPIGRLHPQPTGHPRFRQGIELEHGRGDDAERAFGADEQLFQVVAGIVLAQAAQAIEQLPVGQHDLQAQGQVARVAIAQHLHAPRIGR